jgi:hypothetical protein
MHATFLSLCHGGVFLHVRQGGDGGKNHAFDLVVDSGFAPDFACQHALDQLAAEPGPGRRDDSRPPGLGPGKMQIRTPSVHYFPYQTYNPASLGECAIFRGVGRQFMDAQGQRDSNARGQSNVGTGELEMLAVTDAKGRKGAVEKIAD